MKSRKPSRFAKFVGPTGRWKLSAMTHADLDALAEDCKKLKPGAGRPLSKAQRTEFERWQKKALANEAGRNMGATLALVFPPDLLTRLDGLAKTRHTTTAKLVQGIVEDALQRTVA
jgi:hypothetical protein